MPALVDHYERFDIGGRRFGRLLALIPDFSRLQYEDSSIHWLCRCDCEGVVSIASHRLRFGRTRSCGCLRREMNTTHGDTHFSGEVTTEYACWKAVKARCLNPKTRWWHLYGGRGIAVCDRWRDSFADFLADMGRKPSPSHTIDRIDNDGNYEPGNCRWATKREQNLNRRPRNRESYLPKSRRQPHP